jgi:hypothetical protein
VEFSWGETGCGERMEKFKGECVRIRGFVVGTCLLSDGIGTVKDLFFAIHHAEEFAVQVIDIAVPRCENQPIEEVLGGWRGVGSDCGVNFGNECVKIRGDVRKSCFISNFSFYFLTFIDWGQRGFYPVGKLRVF